MNFSMKDKGDRSTSLNEIGEQLKQPPLTVAYFVHHIRITIDVKTSYGRQMATRFEVAADIRWTRHQSMYITVAQRWAVNYRRSRSIVMDDAEQTSVTL